MNVRQNASVRNGDAPEQLAQLFVVADGKLHVSGHNPGLLVVPRCVSCQFKNLQNHPFCVKEPFSRNTLTTCTADNSYNIFHPLLQNTFLSCIHRNEQECKMRKRKTKIKYTPTVSPQQQDIPERRPSIREHQRPYEWRICQPWWAAQSCPLGIATPPWCYGKRPSYQPPFLETFSPEHKNSTLRDTLQISQPQNENPLKRAHPAHTRKNSTKLSRFRYRASEATAKGSPGTQGDREKLPDRNWKLKESNWIAAD